MLVWKKKKKTLVWTLHRKWWNWDYSRFLRLLNKPSTCTSPPNTQERQLQRAVWKTSKGEGFGAFFSCCTCSSLFSGQRFSFLAWFLFFKHVYSCFLSVGLKLWDRGWVLFMMLWFIFACSQEFTRPIEQEVGDLRLEDEINRCMELLRVVGCNLGCTLESPREVKKNSVALAIFPDQLTSEFTR